MIKHVVMWKLKDEALNNSKEENAKLICKKLNALCGIIPEIVSLETGINENGGDYNVILITEFKSFEDLKTYDCHPEHQKVRGFVREVVDSRVAIDYTVDGEIK